jgi:hypothetical protein
MVLHAHKFDGLYQGFEVSYVETLQCIFSVLKPLSDLRACLKLCQKFTDIAADHNPYNGKEKDQQPSSGHDDHPNQREHNPPNYPQTNPPVRIPVGAIQIDPYFLIEITQEFLVSVCQILLYDLVHKFTVITNRALVFDTNIIVILGLQSVPL